jgi:hypothetical protein
MINAKAVKLPRHKTGRTRENEQSEKKMMKNAACKRLPRGEDSSLEQHKKESALLPLLLRQPATARFSKERRRRVRGNS